MAGKDEQLERAVEAEMSEIKTGRARMYTLYQVERRLGLLTHLPAPDRDGYTRCGKKMSPTVKMTSKTPSCRACARSLEKTRMRRGVVLNIRDLDPAVAMIIKTHQKAHGYPNLARALEDIILQWQTTMEE